MKKLPKMFKVWNKRKKKMQEVVSIEFAASGQYIVTTEEEVLDDEDCVLLRNTGLHDKNGVEIYEGYIVKVYAFSDTPHKIVFDRGAFCIVGKTGFDADIKYAEDERSEVIGNVYEHAHLLPDSTKRV